MANDIVGPITPTNQVGQREDLAEALFIIGRVEKCLTAYLPSRKPATAPKHEYVDDAYKVRTVALGSTLSDSAGAATIVASSTAVASRWRKDVFARINAEVVRCSAVGAASSKDVTVVRGRAGTTIASQTSISTVMFMGRSVLDGADFPTAGATVKSRDDNIVQTFDTPISVADIEIMTDAPGPEEWAHQYAKQLIEHNDDIEYSAIYGVKQTGSATVRRLLGGLKNFITTHSSTSGAADTTTATLTQKSLEEWLAGIYDDGGKPDLLVINSQAAVCLASLGYSKFETRQVGPQPLGIEIVSWVGPFGKQEILNSNRLDYRMWGMANAKGVMMALDRRYLGWSWMQDAGGYSGRTHLEMENDQSSTSKHAKEGNITSHVTLERRAEQCHGILYQFHVAG